MKWHQFYSRFRITNEFVKNRKFGLVLSGYYAMFFTVENTSTSDVCTATPRSPRLLYGSVFRSVLRKVQNSSNNQRKYSVHPCLDSQCFCVSLRLNTYEYTKGMSNQNWRTRLDFQSFHSAQTGHCNEENFANPKIGSV